MKLTSFPMFVCGPTICTNTLTTKVVTTYLPNGALTPHTEVGSSSAAPSSSKQVREKERKQPDTCHTRYYIRENLPCQSPQEPLLSNEPLSVPRSLSWCVSGLSPVRTPTYQLCTSPPPPPPAVTADSACQTPSTALEPPPKLPRPRFSALPAVTRSLRLPHSAPSLVCGAPKMRTGKTESVQIPLQRTTSIQELPIIPVVTIVITGARRYLVIPC